MTIVIEGGIYANIITELGGFHTTDYKVLKSSMFENNSIDFNLCKLYNFLKINFSQKCTETLRILLIIQMLMLNQFL